jgi:hypothetical protein
VEQCVDRNSRLLKKEYQSNSRLSLCTNKAAPLVGGAQTNLRRKDMNSLFLRTLQVIVAGIVLLASPLCAELDHQFMLQVPFDFMAGNYQFPAGSYTIKSDTSAGTVLIRSAEEGPAAFILTFPAGENKDQAHVRLVFHRYGDRYFLSQVWPAGVAGRGLIKSRKEMEVAKAGSRPEVLSIVASERRKASR